jgi:hypothetical protein
MWKFVTKKHAPDDIVLRLPDPVKATSKEAADKMKAANTLNVCVSMFCKIMTCQFHSMFFRRKDR